MNYVQNDKYTPDTARQLREARAVVERLEKAEKTAKINVLDTLHQLFDDEFGHQLNIIADTLMRDAGVVRDALAPFDNGMREVSNG